MYIFQVIKMLIVVVILFVLCWGPNMIIEELRGLNIRIFSQEFYAIKNGFTMLQFVHSCINPIIYCFMSKSFRRSMSRVVGDPCRSCKKACRCCPCYKDRRLHKKPIFSRAAKFRMSSSYVLESATAQTDLETVSSL